MTFSDKLIELRKSKCFSQEDIAEKCNISRQSVSKWETGQGYPETEKLLILCDLLEVDLDYLLRDKAKDTKQEVEAQSIYAPYIGRWVKLFLKDKAYQGFYCIAIIGMNQSHVLFMDDKGKRGVLDLSTISSISDADVNRHKKRLENLPAIPKEGTSQSTLFQYFHEKTCEIRLKQNNLSFTKMAGYYAVVVRAITDNSITVCGSNGLLSTLKLTDILFIKER